MRLLLTLSLVVSLSYSSIAQSEDESSFAITIGGGFTSASHQSSSQKQFAFNQNQISYQQFSDTINNGLTPRLNLSVHVWYNKFISNKWNLQVGLGYLESGFRRRQEDLKLNDITHPGIGNGQINDFTNNRKDVNYDYRFHYINLPVLVNYDILKTADLKTNVQFSAGISFDLLVYHNMVARLKNFTVDEKETFRIKETFHQPRTFSFQLNTGFKIEHKADKNTTLVFQPMFGYFPISTTSGEMKVNPYYFMLHAGIILDTNKLF